MTQFEAMVYQRCPKCREGKIFRGWIKMYEQCPVCGLTYERESGYFLGAMYFSYFLAAPILAVLMVMIWRMSHYSFARVWLIALIVYLPFIPFVFQLSRTLWLHFDRAIDP